MLIMSGRKTINYNSSTGSADTGLVTAGITVQLRATETIRFVWHARDFPHVSGQISVTRRRQFTHRDELTG